MYRPIEAISADKFHIGRYTDISVMPIEGNFQPIYIGRLSAGTIGRLSAPPIIGRTLVDVIREVV